MRRRPRLALALAGGGVIGGMFEVGAVAALEERLGAAGADFDLYVGCSAGSVVASLLANGVRASELYRILDQDIADPLNFRRSAVFPSDAFRRAVRNFARLVWAVARNAMTGIRESIPDMLARAEREMPAGFFCLSVLEQYLRQAYETRALTNSFATLPRPLLIPAIDLDRGERVVFGQGALRDVPISQAVSASSAIPGFFEPYSIHGRDYVDGGVGFTGHADLAAEAGADLVVLINPLVPTRTETGPRIRGRGLYTVMEQASRIGSQQLLELGLAVLSVRHPRTEFCLIEPPRNCALLFGPSMGFEVSRAALRYGYESTRAALADGAPLARQLDALVPQEGHAPHRNVTGGEGRRAPLAPAMRPRLPGPVRSVAPAPAGAASRAAAQPAAAAVAYAVDEAEPMRSAPVTSRKESRAMRSILSRAVTSSWKHSSATLSTVSRALRSPHAF